MRGGCLSALAVVAVVVMVVSAPATERNPLATGLAEEFPWNVSVVPKRKFLGEKGGDHGGSLLVLDPRHLPLAALSNIL